jgi:hypothetical protein
MKNSYESYFFGLAKDFYEHFKKTICWKTRNDPLFP